MAEYHITTMHGPLNTQRAQVIRKQKPAAFQAYQEAVREAIKAQAGLDTVWGVRAFAQTEGAAENVRSHVTKVRAYTILLERVA